MHTMHDKAPVPAGAGWTVTLWLPTGEQAAHVTGIEKRDTALLFAARALAGRDVTLPACARARVEGWDHVRREHVIWIFAREPLGSP